MSFLASPLPFPFSPSPFWGRGGSSPSIPLECATALILPSKHFKSYQPVPIYSQTEVSRITRARWNIDSDTVVSVRGRPHGFSHSSELLGRTSNTQRGYDFRLWNVKVEYSAICLYINGGVSVLIWFLVTIL